MKIQQRDPNKVYSPDKCENDEFIAEYVEKHKVRL